MFVYNMLRQRATNMQRFNEKNSFTLEKKKQEANDIQQKLLQT